MYAIRSYYVFADREQREGSQTIRTDFKVEQPAAAGKAAGATSNNGLAKDVAYPCSTLKFSYPLILN